MTIAIAALAVGDSETALRAMEEGCRERDPNLPFGICGNYFLSLQSHHRYLDILKRMNLGS